jgi:hypothetical protein
MSTLATPSDFPSAGDTNRRRSAAVIVSALTLLIFAVIAAVPWCLRLPLPTTTDEAHYFKFLIRDHDRFFHGGIHKLVTGMMVDDRTRPPGYRIGVAPWVAMMPVNFAQMRLLSLGWLLLSAGIVAATVRRFTGSWASAAVAAVAAALCTKVYLSSIHFGTEYALFLGTAMTYCGLLRDWNGPKSRVSTWIILTAGLAVSALAKASFVVLTLGPIAIIAGLWFLGRVRRPGGWFLLSSIAGASLVAGPWWAFNHRPAWDFALYSVAFRGQALGPFRYLIELFRFEIGLPVALLMVAALLTVVVKWRPHRTTQTHLALLVLLFPPAVIIGLQMVTSNTDGRLIAHGFFPVAIAAGLAIAQLGWLRTSAGAAAVVAALALQAFFVAGPPRFVSAVENRVPVLAVSHDPPLHDWPTIDWEPLRVACAARGLPTPTIAVIGYTNDFNSDQVQIPWAMHGQDLKKVDQLWRSDMGDVDATTAMRDAITRDVIVVVPALSTGIHAADNPLNAEFAAELGVNPDFGPPTVIMVGPDRMTVDVFFRRRH